jgi:uncharacterized surface protein with fasciclin (FAS1) repeats
MKGLGPTIFPVTGNRVFPQKWARLSFHKYVFMYEKSNLIEMIAKEDKFSVFSRIMASSGANDVFKQEGPFTVFVPTNDAFGKIDDRIMDNLLNESGQPKLKALLSYHVIHGKVMAANMGSMQTRRSVTGQEMTFSDKNGIKVNGAGLQARNIEASNGVLHALDTVLAPPIVAK